MKPMKRQICISVDEDVKLFASEKRGQFAWFVNELVKKSDEFKKFMEPRKKRR